jgi:hypothetical protein
MRIHEPIQLIVMLVATMAVFFFSAVRSVTGACCSSDTEAMETVVSCEHERLFIHSSNTLTSDTVRGLSPPYSPSHQPLTLKEKTGHYLKVYGPVSVSSSVIVAGINQARDKTPEWGQGMKGYGRRFASSFGQKAISKSIQFGLECALREDPRYHPSGGSGAFKRTLHAVGQRFISYRDQGGVRPGYSYFAGVAGGVYVSRQWHPQGDRTVSGYLSNGAVSIGIDAAINIFNEFRPDLEKLFR